MWLLEVSCFYSIVVCKVVRLRPRAQRVTRVIAGSIPLRLSFHSLIFYN